MQLSERIALDLLLPLDAINAPIKNAHALVKHFRIPKRSGGERRIVQPSRKMRPIQYWLIHNIFSRLPVHQAATAYKIGSSIRQNAERHRNNRYFLKVDLEDFFPSIKPKDILPLVKHWHTEERPDWEFNSQAENIIRKVCFDKNGQLPIGYSTSPAICNAVMYDFDQRVLLSLNKKSADWGDVTYTRYADDMVFSTNVPGACREILVLVQGLVKTNHSPRIKIKSSKTHFGSSTGGSAMVTGLKVCHGGHLTVHRKYKDHIRLLLALYRKGSLNKQESRALMGHLNYVKSVDPMFYTKLQSKYFASIDVLNSGA